MTPGMRDVDAGKPRASMAWVLIVLVAAILVLGDLNRRMAETRRLERDADALRTEVAVKKTENAVLRTQVAGATSEARVMQWAHEQGGMAQPGEVLVVPFAPDGGESSKATTPAPAFNPPSNWEVWWALLFGG